MTEDIKYIGVRVPASLLKAYEDLAKARERSVSAEVRLAMKAHLETEEKAA